jgi:hypothetical protein
VAELFGLAVGAAGAGALLAAWLRRSGRDWTWGLPTLAPPLLVLALGLLGALPLPLLWYPLALTGGLSYGALHWGLHQHRDDRRSGADRESAAESRLSIIDPLRRRRAERRLPGSDFLGANLPIGWDGRGRLVTVRRGSAASGSHILITGATGAGKTTSLAAFLVEHVRRSGFGAIVLEAKSDAALLGAAEGAARLNRVPFRLISPAGPCGYDPLAEGDVDALSERLLGAQGWGSEDAEFYRQAAAPFLRLLLRTLRAAGRPLTLATVAAACEPDEFSALAVEAEDEALGREATAALEGMRADTRRAIAGLQARLSNLASSQFASAWLDPRREGVHTVRLREAIEAREVVYLRLDTDRTGNVGRVIAQMVLLDLGAVASSFMDAGVGTFVAIDEFGALEAPALDRLFTRARAAGFSVAVGTQTLADLVAAGLPVRERIGATVSSVISHRLGSQADAEWIAQLIGTVPAWETTIRTDRWGRPTEEGTRTRGHRLEVNPAELQRLRPGEAFVARLDEAGPRRARRVRVVPAARRLGDADPRRSPFAALRRRLAAALRRARHLLPGQLANKVATDVARKEKR